jgi:DNA-binding response OmpR family regulator
MILDDDAELRGLLAAQLNDDGAFAATEAGSLRDAWAMLTSRGARFDALLLDVTLPDGDGRDLCAGLRRQGFGMPILMLTGADGEADVVRGLEAGANDYVAKPVRAGELLARLRAQLRSFATSEAAALAIGPYTFRPGMKQLHDPTQNRRIHLTEREAGLLKALYRAGGEPVPHPVLLKEIWGHGAAAHSHIVETHVYRLRRKMELGSSKARRLIVTVGNAYRLDAEPA